MTHNHDHDHNHEYITLIDEDGNEVLHEILFSFESEDYGKNYVLIFPVGTDEDESDEEGVELLAFSYEASDDETTGTLHPIETDEEWEMVEEVLNTFIDENE